MIDLGIQSSCTMCVLKLCLAFLLTFHINCHWIDPDTSPRKQTLKSYSDKSQYKLIFSDEFNVENRFFKDGEDPRWTAMHKNDYTNDALHFYNANLATTINGSLRISTILEDITFPMYDQPKPTQTKLFQTAMIQGWNKFCFTGGIVDISAKLPGHWNIGGLWPAMWLLGNLARATYVGSSNNMWPWSYDECNTDFRIEQAISKCNLVNHFGLNKYQGRGAPEIDILEAMSGDERLQNTKVNRPYFSSSLQVAPAILNYRPVSAFRPDMEYWYNHGIEYPSNNTDLNIFFYGSNMEAAHVEQDYIADALSANTKLNQSHYEEFHNYRLEWEPGSVGYLRWYLDGEYLFNIDASALNITGASIPQEPMYLLFNTAISATWGFPYPCPEGCDCTCVDPRRDECACAVPVDMKDNFPADFFIDYVRVYQSPLAGNESIGCSTPSFPTSQYIQGHVADYMKSGDTQPLLEVANGGGSCQHAADCGFGVCVKGSCSCQKNFTGPTCKAAVAFNDVTWDSVAPIGFSYFLVPLSLVGILTLLAIAFGAVVVFVVRKEKNRAPSQMPPGYAAVIDNDDDDDDVELRTYQ